MKAFTSGTPDFTSDFYSGSCCPVICVSLCPSSLTKDYDPVHMFSSPLVYLTANSKSPGSVI